MRPAPRLPAPGVAARSLAVGAVATVADLAALALLVHVLHVSPRVASVPALALGLATQFAGNKLLAFRDRRPRWLQQGAQFFGVELLALAANLALFDLLVARVAVPYLVARVVATAAVYVGISLPLWTRIFRADAARPA